MTVGSWLRRLGARDGVLVMLGSNDLLGSTVGNALGDVWEEDACLESKAPWWSLGTRRGGATTTSDSDGSSLGRMDTILLGTSEGKLDGSQLGWIEGIDDGSLLGRLEGNILGRADVDGKSEGVPLGIPVDVGCMVAIVGHNVARDASTIVTGASEMGALLGNGVV